MNWLGTRGGSLNELIYDQLASLQKLIDRERAWLSRQPATGAVWPAVDEG
jgi:hypothetical protein